MTLQEQIRNDMVNAMKNKDSETLSLLRVCAGEFSRIGKDLSDEAVIKVLRKMLENAIELGNVGEYKIIDKYLPRMYAENDIRNLVKNIIVRTGASTMRDIGKVMSEIKQHPNNALIDGKIASTIVKEYLTQ